MLVGGAPALDDLQRRPARAVEEVVEKREGKRFHFQLMNYDSAISSAI
jgi:hypothetical protein